MGFDSEYNAWVFDGSGDYIESTLPSTFVDDQVHTVSLWFKRASNHDGTLFSIAPTSGETNSDSKVIQIRTNDSSGYTLSYIFWSNDLQYNPTIVDDTWYHLCGTYTGGGGTKDKKLLYLNGSLIEPAQENGTVTNVLDIDASSKIRLGSRINHASINYLDGSIANFRLFWEGSQRRPGPRTLRLRRRAFWTSPKLGGPPQRELGGGGEPTRRPGSRSPGQMGCRNIHRRR
jgi:hypothetical protein